MDDFGEDDLIIDEGMEEHADIVSRIFDVIFSPVGPLILVTVGTLLLIMGFAIVLFSSPPVPHAILSDEFSYVSTPMGIGTVYNGTTYNTYRECLVAVNGSTTPLYVYTLSNDRGSICLEERRNTFNGNVFYTYNASSLNNSVVVRDNLSYTPPWLT